MVADIGRTMTDHQKDKFGRAADSKRLWSFGSREWPLILSDVRNELSKAYTDLSEARELLALASESSAKATDKLIAEQALSSELSQQCGNAKTSLEKSQETVGALENRLARTELETERIKAELSKTQADLARSQFEQAREKDEHTKTRTIVTLLREWIHTTHRVDIPARNGTIKNILAGMKRLLILAIPLFPLFLNAQFPPPVFRNSWSTNVPPMAVQGFNNLSVTNLGSGTNWQFYNVGPFTVARLMDVTNIASTFAGGGLTTNAFQFLGVPLSIIRGAFLTNMNFWGDGTNNGILWLDGNLMPLADNVYTLGASGTAWSSATVKSGGIQFMETGGGAEFASIRSVSSIGVSYNMVLPDAQGSNGQVITNDGAGNLGWWTPVSSGGFSALEVMSNNAATAGGIRSGLATNVVFKFPQWSMFHTNHAGSNSVEITMQPYRPFAVTDRTNVFYETPDWEQWFDEEFFGQIDVFPSSANIGGNYFANSQGGTVPGVPGVVPLENGQAGRFSISTTQSNSGQSINGHLQAPALLCTNLEVFFMARIKLSRTNTAGDLATARVGIAVPNARAEATDGIYIRSATNADNHICLTTARASIVTTNIAAVGLQQNGWTNVAFYLDGTGTNVIGYIGGSPTNLVSFATNRANIPNTVGVTYWWNNWKLLTSAGNTGNTNTIDYMRIWVRRRY